MRRKSCCAPRIAAAVLPSPCAAASWCAHYDTCISNAVTQTTSGSQAFRETTPAAVVAGGVPLQAADIQLAGAHVQGLPSFPLSAARHRNSKSNIISSNRRHRSRRQPRVLSYDIAQTCIVGRRASRRQQSTLSTCSASRPTAPQICGPAWSPSPRPGSRGCELSIALMWWLSLSASKSCCLA